MKIKRLIFGLAIGFLMVVVVWLRFTVKHHMVQPQLSQTIYPMFSILLRTCLSWEKSNQTLGLPQQMYRQILIFKMLQNMFIKPGVILNTIGSSQSIFMGG